MDGEKGPGVMLAGVAVADATVYYDKLYTYLVPALMEGHIFVGSLVLVPFGRGRAKPRLGVVVQLENAPKADSRTKAVAAVAPEEARLTDELLAIVKYMKEATLCTWFEAVRAVIPYGAQYKTVQGENGAWALRRRMERYTEQVYKARPEAQQEKLTAKQQAVVACVQQKPRSRAEIMQQCGVGPGVADTLVKKGLLESFERDKAVTGFGPVNGAELVAVPRLNEAQQAVADTLAAEMETAAPKTQLLYGVTGSGKTPVFLYLVQKALDAGKTALVLVPEIGLTPQMLGQLRTAFGDAVAVQHSGLNATERLLQWRAIQRGEARVVVGTRSAVFAPLESIGLIVVDEEQERTYQSESAPRYDAIDIARRRAKRHGALLLLASATPSVASFYAARAGRYGLHRLAQRYGDVPLPDVELVDMRGELMAGNPGALSGRLADEMEAVVAGGGQVILLLNRRGYHRVAVCRDCGQAVKCGECSVPMVFHKGQGGGRGSLPAEGPADAGAMPAGRLMCHYCGRIMAPAPEKCPECGGELRYSGFGTQRLEDELAQRLPKARVLRMDLDTTARKGAHEGMLARFAAGEYDVLLGTQMVAKGLDFERVRLVGVIGIDSLLFGQGYRAVETVFSLVTQVVGRAGRSGAQGRAIIQTMDVESPVLQQAARQDYDAFYEEEIGFRKLALYPPFCTLCVAGFVAAEEGAALAAARRFSALLAARARQVQGMPLRVLGPAPMQVMQVAGSFRYRLTLKCRADGAFRALLHEVLEDYSKEGWPQKASVYFDFHGEG